mgnify:CR=1 FL=1
MMIKKANLVGYLVMILVATAFMWRLTGVEQGRLATDKPRHKVSTADIKTEQSVADPNFAANLAVMPARTVTTGTLDESSALAIQLRRCRHVPKSEDELKSWLDEANEVGEPQEYINDVLSRFDLCLSWQDSDQNYLSMLLEASRSGSAAALEELWRVSDTEFIEIMGLTSQDRASLIDTRQSFAKEKYAITESFAIAGDENALLRLVQALLQSDPDINRPNAVKALGFAKLALHLTNNNDFYRKIDWIIQRTENKMTQPDKLRAEQLAERLIDSAMRRTN